MRKILLAGLLVLSTGCALLNSSTPPDPIAVGRALGAISCTVAATEKPELKPALKAALDATFVVLNDPSPTLAAINTALTNVSDPKVRTYAAGTIAVVLALYSNLPAEADAALPPEVVDGLKAAIVACQPIVS